MRIRHSDRDSTHPKNLLSAGMILLSLLTLAMPAAAEKTAVAAENPAEWADRMERAFLPQASMRARLVMRSSDPNQPVQGFSGRLVRVQDEARIRSVLKVEKPAEAVRILRIESTSNGGARRTLYTGPGDPIAIDILRSERILRTSLTYEDLGFVPLAHRGAKAEAETSSGRSVVRLTSEPYDSYSRVVTRVDRELGLPIDVEFFDRSGKLQRKVTYGNVEQAGPYSYPLQIQATDFETGFTTTVELGAVELNAEVQEHEFSDSTNRQLIPLMR